jgi:hypothetical protein
MSIEAAARQALAAMRLKQRVTIWENDGDRAQFNAAIAALDAALAEPVVEDHGTQALWPQMISALAAIDAELGLPEDGCNSTGATLAAIRELKEAAALAAERHSPQRFADALGTCVVPRQLVYELDAVVIDAEKGGGFDAVCLDTVKRVRDAIGSAPTIGAAPPAAEPPSTPEMAALWQKIGSPLTGDEFQRHVTAILLRFAPPPAAEPVAWIDPEDMKGALQDDGWCVVHLSQCDPGADHCASVPLYTAALP